MPMPPLLPPRPDRARLTALANVLKLNERLRLVDVGANPMGRETPYHLLMELGLAQVIGFDPQDDTLEPMRRADEGQARYLNKALGDGQPHQLNLFAHEGLASFYEIRGPTRQYVRGFRQPAESTGQREIQTTRLDDLSEIGRIDMLKMDIQGAEPMVLAHGQERLRDTLAIWTEVSFYPIYQNQPSFGDIDNTLRKMGFFLFGFMEMIRRPILSRFREHARHIRPGQLIDGDALYLRDPAQLRKLSVDEIKRMALLVEGLTGQMDLTLHCLNCLIGKDALTEADITPYLEALPSVA